MPLNFWDLKEGLYCPGLSSLLWSVGLQTDPTASPQMLIKGVKSALHPAAHDHEFYRELAYLLVHSQAMRLAVDGGTQLLIGGIELEPRAGAATQRGLEVFRKCFDAGVLIRVTGDILAFSPPLIIEKSQIDLIADTVRSALKQIS